MPHKTRQVVGGGHGQDWTGMMIKPVHPIDVQPALKFLLIMMTTMKNSLRYAFTLLVVVLCAAPSFAQWGPPNGGHGAPPSFALGYYLQNDTCRGVLEDSMTTTDAAAFEAALNDFRSNQQLLDTIQMQFGHAMRSHDTAAIARIRAAMEAAQKAQADDVATMDRLLKQYDHAALAVMEGCHPGSHGDHNSDTSRHQWRGRGRGGNGGNGGNSGGHILRPDPRLRMEGQLLLMSDSCRWAYEAVMADTDAQAFEAAALELRVAPDSLRAIDQRLVAAFRAHDSVALVAIRTELRQLGDAIRDASQAYETILARYGTNLGTILKGCDHRGGPSAAHILDVQPMRPNPVRSGADVTLNYSLKSDATVAITLSDAMGNTVQTLTNTEETAGDYHLSIPTTGLQAGGYFVRIQATNADGSQVLTQRLMIVR